MRRPYLSVTLPQTKVVFVKVVEPRKAATPRPDHGEQAKVNEVSGETATGTVEAPLCTWSLLACLPVRVTWPFKAAIARSRL
eukprot:4717115-Pleurochrysis_carterae.AAC.1